MKKLIIANWKSNPQTMGEAIRLAKASDIENVVIAPPYLYLKGVKNTLKRAALGSQDLTVPPNQLKKLKVKYVIIGHSDYRRLGETDAMINKKVKTVLRAGLKVILCVGEGRSIRRKGLAASKRFVANQLQKDLTGIRKQELGSRNLLIAYEPVWAISTSKGAKPDTPKNAAQMITHIKKLTTNDYKLKTKVLYGGSVNSRNAKAFLRESEIDGALVGAASLNPKSFKAIIKGWL